jgi:subtilisin
MRRRVFGALAGVVVALSLAAPTAADAAPAEARYVVMLASTVTDPARAAADQARRYGSLPQAVYGSLNGYAAAMSPAEAAALASDPAVQYVAQDRVVRADDRRAAPMPCQPEGPAAAQCLPENIDRIDGEASSTRSGDGRGSVDVNIAVLDGGVDGTHPDLNVAGGVDCTTGSPVVAPSALVDVNGHGTFVAGVAAARDNGSGVVGVAPGAPIWSVKVFDDAGTATEASIDCGIDWVTSTRLDRDEHNDIAVANLSFEGYGRGDDQRCGLDDLDPMHTAICRSVAQGTMYVAAAGNDRADVAGVVPAGYDEVLTATAISDFDGRPGGQAAPICYGLDVSAQGARDDQPAPYSNYATQVRDQLHTVAASGSCVTSTTPLSFGSGYGVGDGTSFAAPAVAGTAALCIDSGRCPDGNPLVTGARLQADAAAYDQSEPGYGYLGDPLRPSGGRYYGYLVNAAMY